MSGNDCGMLWTIVIKSLCLSWHANTHLNIVVTDQSQADCGDKDGNRCDPITKSGHSTLNLIPLLKVRGR